MTSEPALVLRPWASRSADCLNVIRIGEVRPRAMLSRHNSSTVIPVYGAPLWRTGRVIRPVALSALQCCIQGGTSFSRSTILRSVIRASTSLRAALFVLAHFSEPPLRGRVHHGLSRRSFASKFRGPVPPPGRNDVEGGSGAARAVGPRGPAAAKDQRPRRGGLPCPSAPDHVHSPLFQHGDLEIERSLCQISD